MYDENQLVTMKWANKTRRHYEGLGYKFTNYGDEFLVRAKDILPFSRAKLKVTCDYCGEEYITEAIHFFSRKDKTSDACDKCGTRKQWAQTKETRAKKKIGLARQICEEKGYQLLTTEDEYMGAMMKIKFICPKHGEREIILDNFLRGFGCQRCGWEEAANKLKYSTEEIISIVEQYNGNKVLNPEEYIGANVPNLKVQCGLCGNVYTVSLSDYTSNKRIRCAHCSNKESNGEYQIRNFLQDNGINFEQEKTFPDCVNAGRLRFDFYLPDDNMVIEFDGEQHFHSVDFFGGKDNFEGRVLRDKIKDDYCHSHNIHLLRIPYNEMKNIDTIISNKLNHISA